jgi:hypothetical protein
MTPPSNLFHEFIASTSNASLAKALEYLGEQMAGGISDAILKEAARRLRGEPEPHFVEPPPRDNPPLKAYALPD